MVERRVREGQPLALSAYQRVTIGQSGSEHVGTLIQTYHLASVPMGERSRDHGGASGNIEYSIALLRTH